MISVSNNRNASHLCTVLFLFLGGAGGGGRLVGWLTKPVTLVAVEGWTKELVERDSALDAFVRARLEHTGEARDHVCMRFAQMHWVGEPPPNVSLKALYDDYVCMRSTHANALSGGAAQRTVLRSGKKDARQEVVVQGDAGRSDWGNGDGQQRRAQLLEGLEVEGGSNNPYPPRPPRGSAKWE